MFDPSLQTKAGVQRGLVGSAIQQLGTEEHRRRWVPRVMSLVLIGC